jgi:hypothetical protein
MSIGEAGEPPVIHEMIPGSNTLSPGKITLPQDITTHTVQLRTKSIEETPISKLHRGASITYKLLTSMNWKVCTKT